MSRRERRDEIDQERGVGIERLYIYGHIDKPRHSSQEQRRKIEADKGEKEKVLRHV